MGGCFFVVGFCKGEGVPARVEVCLKSVFRK